MRIQFFFVSQVSRAFPTTTTLLCAQDFFFSCSITLQGSPIILSRYEWSRVFTILRYDSSLQAHLAPATISHLRNFSFFVSGEITLSILMKHQSWIEAFLPPRVANSFQVKQTFCNAWTSSPLDFHYSKVNTHIIVYPYDWWMEWIVNLII